MEVILKGGREREREDGGGQREKERERERERGVAGKGVVGRRRKRKGRRSWGRGGGVVGRVGILPQFCWITADSDTARKSHNSLTFCLSRPSSLYYIYFFLCLLSQPLFLLSPSFLLSFIFSFFLSFSSLSLSFSLPIV